MGNDYTEPRGGNTSGGCGRCPGIWCTSLPRVSRDVTPTKATGKIETFKIQYALNPLAPAVRGLRCPPAPPSDHWYEGLVGLLGDSEAWKPQQVGGCGWTRCPRNSDLSHAAQDTARSWGWGCFDTIAHIQAIFLAVSRTYRGVRRQERALCHGAIEAHVQCSNHFPSFGCFDWVSGRFWAKKGHFGAQSTQFLEGTSRLGAPAPGRHR